MSLRKNRLNFGIVLIILTIVFTNACGINEAEKSQASTAVNSEEITIITSVLTSEVNDVQTEMMTDIPETSETLATAAMYADDGPVYLLLNNDYGRWRFVDRNGEWLIEPRFENRGLVESSFFEGLAFVYEMNGKGGYIDYAGNWVIEPVFDEGTSFQNGLASVKDSSSGKYGVIDITGDWVIEPNYGSLIVFGNDDIAPVREYPDGKYGYIDKEENWVIPPMFEVAYPFSEGFAAASDGLSETGEAIFGYINQKGEWAIEPRFIAVEAFDNAWARVAEARVRLQGVDAPHYGYINTLGEWIVEPR